MRIAVGYSPVWVPTGMSSPAARQSRGQKHWIAENRFGTFCVGIASNLAWRSQLPMASAKRSEDD